MENDRCNGAKNSNCATTANGGDGKNLHDEDANVCSELCDTDPAPTQITVDYSGDLFAVYDRASAMRLITDYQISGHCMDGSTWNDDRHIVIRQCQGFQGCVVERRRQLAVELDNNLMAKARAVVVGRKIKERKRKFLGGQAPAHALKVRKKDETDFTDDIDEREVLAAAEELRERQRRENEKKEAEDVLHVPLCGPSTSYAILPSPPVPNTIEYARKFTVFRDLWRKGFYLTNGIKFGCDYLAYEQPPGVAHSKYMVFCFDASQSIAPLNLVSASRVASQVSKQILAAFVATGSLLPYYMTMNWWKGDSNKIRSNVSVPDDEEKIPRTTVVAFVASLCGANVVVIAADRRRMFNKQPQDDADKFIEVENHRRIAVVGFSGEDWSIRQTAGATLCEYAYVQRSTLDRL
ncbi:tRNA intron endonuclease family protein [Aphelenchoides avenae]|nr:tRNA intron endonuclease family protein [Aphelenchus avenae]